MQPPPTVMAGSPRQPITGAMTAVPRQVLPSAPPAVIASAQRPQIPAGPVISQAAHPIPGELPVFLDV